MSVVFPTTLDSFTNPTAAQTLATAGHVALHSDAFDAIEVLEAKVGVNSSAVTTSHDYKLSTITSTAKAVSTAGAQTIAGTKTFSSFPVTPSSAPTTDYQVANKKYVDDSGDTDGWIDPSETWTYASASTITVPSGAASKYQKGDKIKWTQTTVKYGVISTVADTLLTIIVNDDYVVTNAAISANYYSKQENPQGFPARFNYTPTITKPTGLSSTVTKYGAYYTVTGGTIFLVVYFGTASGSGTVTGTHWGVTLPVNRLLASATAREVGSAIFMRSHGGIASLPHNTQSLDIYKYDFGVLTTGTDEIIANVNYKF